MNKNSKKKFDEMKAKHQDAILLFRVGDFYETYEEDAVAVAEILGITLTKKGDTRMAGFPHQSLDEYLPKLVRAGKRVAMCEQMKEEKPKALTYGEVVKIPVAEIQPSPMNPRKTFYEDAIKELSESIRQHGLLQPITVRAIRDEVDPLFTGGYEIVMGERRFRAWKENMAQIPDFPKEIPCIVREMNDEEALDAMITENLQRKDVDPIEEAFAFGQLHANGKSIEEIANRFGKSKRFIQERIKLDNLLPELKQFVTKEWMTIGAAMHICKLTEEEQRKFFNDFAEDYDIEAIDSDGPITKQDAVEFTDNLFMTIDRADWDKTFEGSCGTTCEKCPFNNANVGCLFYEMKEHNATCTNRDRWNAKRVSWLMKIVEDNADVLVKEGEDLEAGKTIVLKKEYEYYVDRCPEFKPIIDRIAAMGARIAKADDFFETWSSYHEDDERLQEKLKNNEVYRCLVVSTDYRGTEVYIRYYTWKSQVAARNEDEVKAMNLVKDYKENIRRNDENRSNKLREVLNTMNPEELSLEPLTENEQFIFNVLILRKCSHKLREKRGFTGYQSTANMVDYMKEHPEEVNLHKRDYIREVLGGTDVTWNTDLQQCQSMLLQDWASEKVSEIEGEYAVKLEKKQAKIREQLTLLGYNTDGTKMEF